MYLPALAYENAGLNTDGEFSLSRVQRTIAKWTLVDAGARNTELLQLIVASFNGILLSRRFPTVFHALCRNEKSSLPAAHLRVLHEGSDMSSGHGLEATAGITATAHGEVRSLFRSPCRKRP